MKKLMLIVVLLLAFATPGFAAITPDYVNASAGVGVAAKYFGGLEMEFYHEPVTSFTATNTPASGTCATQIVLKNMGATVTRRYALPFYISSDSAGATPATVTSVAALTNGAVIENVAGSGIAISKTDGTIGMTITAGAGSYYVNFVLEGGTVVTGAVCTVN